MQNFEKYVMTPSVHRRPKDVRGLASRSTHVSLLVGHGTTAFTLY